MLTSLSISATETPLLNRERRATAVIERSWLEKFCGVYVSGLTLWGELTFLDHPHWVVAIQLVTGMAATFWLCVLVHELGHLAAGSFMGYRLVSFQVIGFRYSKCLDGRCIQFNSDLPRSFGSVQMTPQGRDGLSLRALIFTAGGPAATLLILAIAWTARGMLLGKVALIANSFVCLGCFLPAAKPFYSTDAQVILTLLRKGAAAERLSAVFYLLSCPDQLNPKKWPPEIVSRLNREVSDPTYEASALALRYFHNSVCASEAAIAATLERLLELSPYLPLEWRRKIFQDAGNFQLFKRGNTRLASQWLLEAQQMQAPQRC